MKKIIVKLVNKFVVKCRSRNLLGHPIW